MPRVRALAERMLRSKKDMNSECSISDRALEVDPLHPPQVITGSLSMHFAREA